MLAVVVPNSRLRQSEVWIYRETETEQRQSRDRAETNKQTTQSHLLSISVEYSCPSDQSLLEYCYKSSEKAENSPI